jgi:hypothetical protein
MIAVPCSLGCPSWAASHPCYEHLSPDPTPPPGISFEDFLRVLSLAVQAFRGDLTKDAELLVLRHENSVPRPARLPVVPFPDVQNVQFCRMSERAGVRCGEW